jgi:hypothetical protein
MVARPHVAVQLAQGTECVTIRPKHVTVRLRVCLEDRVQESKRRLSDHPIPYRRNLPGALAPVRAGAPLLIHPSNPSAGFLGRRLGALDVTACYASIVHSYGEIGGRRDRSSLLGEVCDSAPEPLL